MSIPNFGWAAGIGVIGFGVSYIVMAELGRDYDGLMDIGVGVIVAAIAWLIMFFRRKP